MLAAYKGLETLKAGRRGCESVGIPDQWVLAGHIVVDWPRGQHGPVRRRPIADVVFRNRWDAEHSDITYGRGARPRD